MAAELNKPNHRYYQLRNHVKLPEIDMSKQWIYADGIRKIDDFMILPLFAGATPGVWYDPSDLTTLFTDTAGTTPVTTPGQTVGLMLDKSQGLVLGSELLSNGVIGLVGVSTAATYSTTTGVGSVSRVAASNQSYVQWSSLTSTSTYKLQVTCTSGAISVRAGVVSASVFQTLTAGQTLDVYASPVGGFLTITNAPVLGTATFTVTSLKLIAGNHATQATSAQRPTYQVDSNGKPYLLFDGVDDGMVTNTITPATNKVQVFTGARKLSDAASGMLVELGDGTSQPGIIGLRFPSLALAGATFSSRGTLSANATVGGIAAPSTNVLTGLGDIAAPSAILRSNGVQVGIDTATQGTGNFLAYPIYIGRRAGTSNPFNGRLYSLIVRFGANLTASQIASTESWVNAKTGAY